MTLTTERLREIAEDGFLEHGDAKLMARELLANREAQPVQVTDEMALAFHRALNDGGIGEADLEEIKVGLSGALCNITAPPAPAVPDESDPRDAFESVFPMPKYVVRCGTGYAVTAYSAWGAHDFKERWEGWNACRAAMLAQPVSGGYKLPEGWKLVPIEPTTEMINAALASGALSIRTAYRAMLAAAPEGGNDHNTRR
ncbi:hypothetical protein [Serratia sp. KG1D]|uniref:hypothetical protein n=1 Tax=Serratia sp. KG1D TaxID=3120277 RepID=UPI00301B0E78